MQRVTLIGSAIGAALSRGFGAVLSVPSAVHRVASGTKRARQMVSAKTAHNRSKYVPHIGAKEQERAKRCWMQPNFGWGMNGDQAIKVTRSAPVMNQMSKRQHDVRQARKQAA
ncbi:hypothetical protein SB781_03350 [Paraburkholderia sp. SIMBA_061]